MEIERGPRLLSCQQTCQLIVKHIWNRSDRAITPCDCLFDHATLDPSTMTIAFFQLILGAEY
jgi:hypothetical protein